MAAPEATTCCAEGCSNQTSQTTPLGLEETKGIFCAQHMCDLWNGEAVTSQFNLVTNHPSLVGFVDLTKD